jgi:hypothetical protein
VHVLVDGERLGLPVPAQPGGEHAGVSGAVVQRGERANGLDRPPPAGGGAPPNDLDRSAPESRREGIRRISPATPRRPGHRLQQLRGG